MWYKMLCNLVTPVTTLPHLLQQKIPDYSLCFFGSLLEIIGNLMHTFSTLKRKGVFGSSRNISITLLVNASEMNVKFKEPLQYLKVLEGILLYYAHLGSSHSFNLEH